MPGRAAEPLQIHATQSAMTMIPSRMAAMIIVIRVSPSFIA
jgi:hypothetical protein